MVAVQRGSGVVPAEAEGADAEEDQGGRHRHVRRADRADDRRGQDRGLRQVHPRPDADGQAAAHRAPGKKTCINVTRLDGISRVGP